MAQNREERVRTLVDQIEQSPGANLRQIQRLTDIPLATTNRLLEELEADGLVRSELERSYRRYYPAGKGLHKRERILLGFLSKPRPRMLLEAIDAEPGIQHGELALEVELPPPTVTYYMKQLIDADLIHVRRVGVTVHYRIKNPAMLRKALARTEASFDPMLA